MKEQNDALLYRYKAFYKILCNVSGMLAELHRPMMLLLLARKK